MPLSRLLAKAAEVAAPVLQAARTTTAAPTGRRVWAGRHRSHLEVRGLHEPGSEATAREIEARVADVDGVRRAEINGVLGRVVVEHEPGVDIAALSRLISDVEGEHGLDAAEMSPRSTAHPANAEPVLREAAALVISLAGLGYATAAALLPVRVLPPLLPAAVSLVDTVPWMRRELERKLGRAPADSLLALGGAVSHGLSRSPLGVFTHLCVRFCASREMLARQQAWAEWERSSVHRCDPVAVEPRPQPVPDGLVERVAGVSGTAALAGYGTVLAASRNPPRALAMLVAGAPKPAKAGREAFAAQLTTAISARGGLVLDPDALRRLDRVDTVVFDAPVLLTGRRAVDSVVPVDPEADAAELFVRASRLVDPQDPTAEKVLGDWSAGPQSGDVVLRHRGEVVARVDVVDELDPLAEALVEAARANGAAVVAGDRLDDRLPLERVVPGGNRLARSVRRLQAEGAVVAVVSARADAALTAADVGIGLSTSDQTPWGADVLCPRADVVHMLLSATENARAASRNAALLSVVGSCLGALFTAFGPALGAPARASMPVQATTLTALFTGTWAGIRAADRAPPIPQERTPWHAMPPDAALSTLASSERGLSRSIAASRHQHRDRGRARPGIARATAAGLITPITPVLGAGAVVSAGLGSVVDAALIVGVLLASALVDGVQRVATDRELTRLLDAGQVPARRRREGTVEVVPADQLVPGDVVELRAGDGVPADCRLLSTDGLEVDESSMTGESQLVVKDIAATTAPDVADRTCMVYRGTAVASGTGTAVVVAVGTHTELGRTARTSAPETGNGVEARLGELTKKLLPVSIGAGGVLFVADLLRGVPLGRTVARSVGLAVAAVPEGVPFVATLAELAAARRLAGRGVLVRSPATIEALGRVDALCFDKTGTLTQGRIALGQISDGRTAQPTAHLDERHREIVAAGVRATPRQSDEHPLPHLTDRAVLDGARAAGVAAEETVLAELPFEPSRSFHAVRVDGLLSVKGAPEVVLDRCARRRTAEGSEAFDAAARAEVEREIERLAADGYRLLAVAERAATAATELTESDVDDLEFVGLLGLADPVHPAAAEAVAQLSSAGVDVIMITGDHPSTAEAIAAELGVLGGKRVLTGAELDRLDDEQLTGELPGIAVFARVSPAQKARIVSRLRAGGRVVAMTGDGANDVPAINLAQVGIAFGSRATPAAREAADLVVAEDRIETLTDGIVEGRGMWTSVRDALSILLGGNLGEIGHALGTGLLSPAAGLNARQLLVVNLLTDVLPAIAIAVRPPPHATPEKLLAEGPEVSLGSALAHDVYARAAATAGAAGLAWLLARPLSTAAQARTTGLVALVSAQLAQTLAVRGRTPLVLAAGAGSLVLLVAVVQLPGISRFFGSSPLLPHQWAIAAGTSIAAALAVLMWQKWRRNTS
ncbi:cation-transporting ATPase I [Saccharopolyspora kobensis]|uniref:Cation-transporting ATPase I n=2 Tax=Saccharopolyspora kobensis TaxID=146035 RepID=A0A1H5XEJ7_9PSEU|nr:cation-translocating P-type ATPase [Saccharopolyspora kobensis]SEG10198.1 cation-transporting ATPase I [Saccharopolyspora kobensis]SFE43807.1 cation-transporting ATPase I [Saccharopolyspora kobensis]